MENKLLLEEINKQLEIKFPHYTFEIFEDKYIGCREISDMVITCDNYDERIFCYGHGARKLGLDCYDMWYHTKYAKEIYNEVLECLKGDEDER